MTRVAAGARLAAVAIIISATCSTPAAAQVQSDPLGATQPPAQLGMLSTGFGYNGIVLGKGGSQLLSPETYFSRGTRGTRTDVVFQ